MQAVDAWLCYKDVDMYTHRHCKLDTTIKVTTGLTQMNGKYVTKTVQILTFVLKNNDF